MLNEPANITPITNNTGKKIFLSKVILNFVSEINKFNNKAPNSQGSGK